jgi:hypothetical protein
MVDNTVLSIKDTQKEDKDPEKGFKENKNNFVPRQATSPVKVYTSNIGRQRAPSLRWESPEWDLAECGRIIDTESLVRRAFTVKEALFTKEGYDFVGQNPQRVAYVRKRLQQMEHAGGVPFPILMSWTINSLIRTSNAFWVKKRDRKASGGGPRITSNNKSLEPVAAYFSMPSETVRFKRDEFGRMLKYKQVIQGKEPIDFEPQDIIHFYFDKREGFSVGTPSLVPVKDDIRALRRIEENIELLVYAHLFPLYHYKVGTDSAPAMMFSDGTTEVQVVQQAIGNMPSDGCWVTPERHNIEVVGANGEALDTDKILAHFKQRIFTGLGVSSVDMGEGGTSNRSTAQTMSRNLVDRTKAEQRILEAFINKFVIEELLLESAFPQEDIFAEENMVRISFKEIDNEAKQALENHAIQMYVQNGFNHDEMREYMGKEPWTEEDWEKSHWKQIDEPTKLMQSLDEPYSAEAKAIARANTTSITEPDLKEAQTQKEKERKEELGAKKASIKKPQALPTRKNNLSANRNKPVNQHGVRKATKSNKDFSDAYSVNPEIPGLDSIFSQRAPISYVFNSLRDDIIRSIRSNGFNEDMIHTIIGSGFEHGKDILISHAKRAYRTGINDTGINYWDIRLNITDSKIEKHITYYVYKLRDELMRSIKRQVIGIKELGDEDAFSASLVIDTLAHRSNMIDESEVMRAYNAGRGDAYKAQGVENIKIERTGNSDCSICGNSTLQWTATDVIIYEDLPPLHPHCRCILKRVDR